MKDFYKRPAHVSYELMRVLSKISRKSRDPLTAILDASMTEGDRITAPWAPLPEHYERLGWAGDGAEHQAALQRDGFVRITQDEQWFWIIRKRVPWWVRPMYLLDRCANCIAADNYQCGCTPLNDVTSSMKLYVLKLEEGRYYVGTSQTPIYRLTRHASRAGGSIWTERYLPLRIVSCRIVDHATHLKDEDDETLELMRRYGVDRVQGGTFTGEAGQERARLRLERERGTVDAKSPIHLTFVDLQKAAGGAA
jgi:hypothetical protein